MPFDNYGNYIPYPIYPNNNYLQQNQVNKQPIGQNTYAFVNGLEGAKSFIVQPNQTVLLMDSEQPICYMKTANSIGQSSLRYFKLTETSENEIRGLSNKDTQPTTDYVSRNEFDNLIERIKKLEGATNNNE